MTPDLKVRGSEDVPLPAHFVYIVRCRDGSLYTGYARDPQTRAAVHNSGRGARYTSSRLPVRLVYVEPCESLGAALSREHEIKSLKRLEKAALVATQRRRRKSSSITTSKRNL